MTSRRGEPWTDIDDDELRKLFAAGTPPVRIALQLGRTQEAISARRVRLGLRRG